MITTYLRELARMTVTILVIVAAVSLLSWLLPTWARWPFFAVLLIVAAALSTRERMARAKRPRSIGELIRADQADHVARYDR